MLSGVHDPAHVALHRGVGAVSGLLLPGGLKKKALNNHISESRNTNTHTSLQNLCFTKALSHNKERQDRNAYRGLEKQAI